MGKNYYANVKVCQCCKRPEHTIHIGKSSMGCMFSLRVYGYGGKCDLGVADAFASLSASLPQSWDDWKEVLALVIETGGEIKDEYADVVSLADFCEVVEKREGVYGSGPLRRHDIDGSHCVGHGEGTWDYIAGAF